MDYRYDCAVRAVLFLKAHNVAAYSPIVHWHPVAKAYELPRSIDFWRTADEAAILKADHVAILWIAGLTRSEGCTQDYDFASSQLKDIFLLVPKATDG